MKLFWLVLLFSYQGQTMAQSWPGFAKQQSCLELYPDYQQLVNDIRQQTPWYKLDHWLAPWLLPEKQFETTQQQLDCAQLEYYSDNFLVQAWGLQPKTTASKKWPVIIYNRGGNATFCKPGFFL